MEGDLVVAVGGDLVEIAVPGFARIDPEFLARLAGQRIPGAFDVGGGERLAVMPFDTLTQVKGQRRPGLVPHPVAGEIGDDGGEAVLRWSNRTKLLKTPISGMPAAIVDSSWIDMLAGLAKPGICRMPPGFCANAGPANSAAASSAPAITY